MASDGAASVDFFGGSFTLAASALCCYEYVITLDEEMRCIWRRRISAASVLFVLNRYAILAASFASLFQVLPWGQQSELSHYQGKVSFLLQNVCLDESFVSCSNVVLFVDTCLIMTNVAYVVLAALRMLALYGMNKFVFASVFVFGLCNPCAQIFLMSVEASDRSGSIFPKGTFPTTTGRIDCYHSVATALLPTASDESSVADLVYSREVPLLRMHALAFEGLLIGLTWKKMVGQWSSQRSAVRTPFTTTIIRSGTLYFIVIATASTMSLIGVLVLVLYPTALLSDSTYLTMVALASAVPIVDTITSICMSRFILGLLAISLDEHSCQLHSSRWETLRFATVVGSLAGTFGTNLQTGDTDTVE